VQGIPAGLREYPVITNEHRIEAWAEQHCSLRVGIVKRSEDAKDWELLPNRWVVERTYGWLNRWRGLAREYD
jgi:transposase